MFGIFLKSSASEFMPSSPTPLAVIWIWKCPFAPLLRVRMPLTKRAEIASSLVKLRPGKELCGTRKVRFDRKCAMRLRPISFFSGTVLRAIRVFSIVPIPRMTAPPLIRLYPNDAGAVADQSCYIDVIDDHQTLLCVGSAEVKRSGLLCLCLRDPSCAD